MPRRRGTGAGGLLLFNANVSARRTPRRSPASIARHHPICTKLSMIEWHEIENPAFTAARSSPRGGILFFSLLLFHPRKAMEIFSFISLITGRSIRESRPDFKRIPGMWNLQSKVISKYVICLFSEISKNRFKLSFLTFCIQALTGNVYSTLDNFSYNLII